MGRFFVLFLVAHLLIDLGAPGLPGAFRFNPDESVVAVRVHPVNAETPGCAAPRAPVQPCIESSRVAPKPLVGLDRSPDLPDLIPLLPRRDPSSDRSPRPTSEDA